MSSPAPMLKPSGHLYRLRDLQSKCMQEQQAVRIKLLLHFKYEADARILSDFNECWRGVKFISR